MNFGILEAYTSVYIQIRENHTKTTTFDKMIKMYNFNDFCITLAKVGLCMTMVDKSFVLSESQVGIYIYTILSSSEVFW